MFIVLLLVTAVIGIEWLELRQRVRVLPAVVSRRRERSEGVYIGLCEGEVHQPAGAAE